ncbi:MAG: AIR synthase-related protein [Candidatus Nanoarchaeia archaeon]|jgi:phosphoribosylformylglycinamidine synthase
MPLDEIAIRAIKRIEIERLIPDTRAQKLKTELNLKGYSVTDLKWLDVYTINEALTNQESDLIAKNLAIACNYENGIKIHSAHIYEPASIQGFDQAIETGFLPGVTDNIGKTAKIVIEDTLERKLNDVQGVYTSRLLLIKGITGEQAREIPSLLINKLIERSQIKNNHEYLNDHGMGATIPKVNIDHEPRILDVDLELQDDELIKLGKEGIYDPLTKMRRGPLALDIESLKSIKEYYNKISKKPTDIELESIAQTWSEHCKHRIFSGSLDDITEGIFNKHIKGATNAIRAELGENDFCTSVFSDNSGAIKFNDIFSVCFKSETHNSPSALDPFGGAITGIVGVNRDTLGFGLGALPVNNSYYFMFGELNDMNRYFKNKELTDEILSSESIMNGVIAGVNAGGNQSGIPTNVGGMYMHSSYRGKPLVYVGTSGIIPTNKIEKKANPGDLIVVIGGRVGADGVHGATFSSEALTSGSPATAVQIGDAITQKKLSDSLLKEARDLEFYTSITDNGAGGLSCSVAEMAQESGGFTVNLNKVPLKYAGLQPWEIWISESQERMTLSVPKNKIDNFMELMKKHDVETSIIGEFTNSGKAQVNYNNQLIINLDMDFLHNGAPKKIMKSEEFHNTFEEPNFAMPELNSTLDEMLSRYNICSKEFISTQYDHEVQGGSVIKPLIGKGRLQSKAGVYKPLLDSNKGVVEANGLCPTYSQIDTYDMAMCSIDTAIRNALSVGGSLKHMALLDNFCWNSSEDPKMLYLLKRATEACYDYATKLKTPFISGKDSMFNDFKGYDAKGKPVKISVLPTLKIQACGVIDDVNKCITHEAKFENDLVYVIGETFNELGGSEYFRMKGNHVGNNVPKVRIEQAIKTYNSLEQAINNELLVSCNPVNIGGLGVALSEASLGGKIGMNIDINGINSNLRDDFLLFSESQSRFVVTVNPELKEEFENTMQGIYCQQIGTVEGDSLIINNGSKNLINMKVTEQLNAYKKTFANKMSVAGWDKESYMQGDWL